MRASNFMDIQVYSGVEKFRSNLPEVFCKKTCSKIFFGTLIRKQTWWSSVSLN